METFEAFKQKQEKTIDVLKKLLSFLQTGKEIGIQIEKKYLEKVEHGIKATEGQKLKVALVGGFSEGKTSIAAAWSEHYDKSTMKISQSESSNEITVHSLGDFDLIDTPGLFGFKETSDKEKYKDITKKYVSEAHLVLYVMNPTNPIKESHKEELVWLFKELNLLDRTVFVISRFDEEVDIEDEDDYTRGMRVKTDNIVGRLRDFGIISNTDTVNIVAVSANPFDRGIEYWLTQLDEFKRLSHIHALQEATTNKIKSAGNTMALMLASQKSIVADILKREVPVAEKTLERIKTECEQFNNIKNDIDKDMNKTKTKISKTLSELKSFVLEFFTDLILQAKGTSMETFTEFCERNIGNEGIVLETRIQNEFARQLGNASSEIKKMQISYNAGVQQYSNTVGQMTINGLKMGAEFLKTGGVNITNTGILAARNVLNLPIKFKPWGAVKLASGLNTAIPIIGSAIGIGFELWDTFSKMEKEKKFKQSIDKMVENFELQRKEYLEILKNETTFKESFFPDLIELQNQIEMMDKELANKQEQLDKFTKWKKEGEIIEAEFQVVG